MIQDILNCEKLGIRFYNFHPGTLTSERSVENFIEKVGETINYVHEQTKESSVILLLESAAGQGCEVGGDFQELRVMMDLVENKQRIGVCLDTCHIFAAGYDIGSPMGYERTMAEFDKVIGLKNLKAIHLNDSKGTFGCRQDRHATIGQGCIGLNAFRFVMNDSRLNGIPMILETPRQKDEHLSEIQLLQSFEGYQTDPEKIVEEFHHLTLDEISNEIKQFHLKNSQDECTFNAKEALRLKLELSLQQEFGEECHLVGVGSFITGLGRKDSDLDLSLLIPKSINSISQSSFWQSSIDNLRRAQEVIPSKSELRTGVVPVLRFRMLEVNNIQVDMSCNYLECIYNTRLLRCYSKLDSRFSPLCSIIKEWAAIEGINNAKEGFLNSYTILLLIVHYLQVGCDPPMLPNLQALYPGSFPKEGDNPLICMKQFTELEMVSVQSMNESSLAELLTGFFSYYSTFPFEEKWISIKSGSVRKRSELDCNTSKFLVYVEDPFEEKSTARCVLEKEKLQKIRNSFHKAFCKCHRGLGIRYLGL